MDKIETQVEENGITVERLCKSYGGKTVLRDVSFHVKTGQTLCLMAPSGGGKTTLLRILLGLEKADGGIIRMPSNLRWAAVFQEDRLLEQRDAADNLRFVLGRDGDSPKTAALLDLLGLADTGGKAVRDFSGGMRRRLALARALLAPSGALALDEPLTGLDGENRRRCLEAIRRYGAGKSILLATHAQADAEALNAAILRLSAQECEITETVTSQECENCPEEEEKIVNNADLRRNG